MYYLVRLLEAGGIWAETWMTRRQLWKGYLQRSQSRNKLASRLSPSCLPSGSCCWQKRTEVGGARVQLGKGGLPVTAGGHGQTAGLASHGYIYIFFSIHSGISFKDYFSVRDWLTWSDLSFKKDYAKVKIALLGDKDESNETSKKLLHSLGKER